MIMITITAAKQCKELKKMRINILLHSVVQEQHLLKIRFKKDEFNYSNNKQKVDEFHVMKYQNCRIETA